MQNLSGYQKRVAILVAATLSVAVIGALLIRLWLTDFDTLAFIGVASTLAIALLTVSYVMVSSGQLGVMQQQLIEMARTRELESQPLPYLEIKKLYFERPHFFYTPPEDKYHAVPRFLVTYRVVNKGSYPAVNIVATARVIIKLESRELVFDGGANEISVLGPQAEHPPGSSSVEELLFTEDYLTKLVATLRDRSFRYPPLLSVRLIYKNVLGACFAGTWYFQFAPKSAEDFDILGNWESQLVSFEVQYKEQLAELRRAQEKDDKRWGEVFVGVKISLDKSLKGDAELEMGWFEIPNSYRTEVLSRERYAAELTQRNFGRPIPKWIASCVAKDAEEHRA